MAKIDGRQGFCESSFWDHQLSWNTTDPDFTPCAQKTMLALSPVAFLLLLAPYKLYTLCHLKDRIIKWNWLSCSRLVLAGLIGVLMGIQCVTNVLEQSDGTPVPTVNFISPLFISLAMGLVSVFIFLEHRKGVRASGYLFIFWLLMLITGIFIFRSQIRHAVLQGNVEKLVEFVTIAIQFVLVIASFVLSSLVDKSPEFEEVQQDEHPCPKSSASFLSCLTFWWISSLIIKGYKQAVVKEDLWSLSDKNKSATVKERFEKHWQAQINDIKRKESLEAHGVQTEAVYKDGAVSTEVKVINGSKTRKPSFLKTLIYTFGTDFVQALGYRLLMLLFVFFRPQLLKKMIQFTQNKEEPIWHGYLYATLLYIVSIAVSFNFQYWINSFLTMGLRIRAAIMSAVYCKAFKLSNSAKRKSTVGEIINLMTVDSLRFSDLSYIYHILTTPLEIFFALFFLWQLMGPAVVAGVGILVLITPLNAFLAYKSRQLHLKQMTLKDTRIKQMNEVLNGIKVLKLYAWETTFCKKIETIHNKELTMMKKGAYINAVHAFSASFAPFLVALITFAIYTLADENNVLDAQKAFVALSFFKIIQNSMNVLPHAITNSIQLSVSVKRLQKFLDNDELDPNCVQHSLSAKHSVKIENGTFTWDTEEPKTLTDINLQVDEGSLVAVVGAVGTGKSSLLSALLGEMDKLSGTVSVKGSFAYVAQLAWIQNATLRDNILFNKEFKQDTYDQVISACALLKDLDVLPAGDQTEIGEKGINLSGGQKQRVSLARAVYHDADVYLLDDPLSAVDSHVGKHLFDHVIGPEGLLKGKTRILVTHSIRFLPTVDKIVVMKDGKISESGSFTQLMDHNGAFAEFLRNYLTHEIDEISSASGMDQDVHNIQDSIIHQMDVISRSESVPSDSCEVRVGTLLQRQVSTLSERICTLSDTYSSQTSLAHSFDKHAVPMLMQRQISALSDQMEPLSETGGSYLSLVSLGKDAFMTPDMFADNLEKEDTEKVVQIKEKDTLIEDESSETGKVNFSVFKAYFQAAGAQMTFIFVFLLVLSHAVEVAKDFWLSDWSDDGYMAMHNDTNNEDKLDMRLGVYGSLGFLEALLALTCGIWLSIGSRRAAKQIHNTILPAVFHLPMKFFDVTPLGRIINRFSKDIEIIDLAFAGVMTRWLHCALVVLNTLVVVAVSTPIFLSVILPLGIFYFAIQLFFVRTARQLKRLESTSRSPIFSHFGESIMGATTIRAFNEQEHFIKQSEAKVDMNHACYYPLNTCNRWLALRLEFVGSCVCLFAALFAVLGRDDLSPGIVGLSVSYAMEVTRVMNILTRFTCEVENEAVSVERVLEYSKIPKEADWNIPEKKPDAAWPQKGVISFSNLKLRYREGLDLVLKGISCSIKSGEKIGIVGRTGAGKSSLTLALFRIIEAAEGEIILDDISIGDIGLHDLRSKLTIIPQDPVVFSGTLRMNIDPFEQYSDEQLWQALEHAHLKDFVQGLQAELQHECTEGGENLSVGQRQLLCLARALLRKTKVLILDEATAAVDMVTDDLIQATIRTEFAECTVLTIAHRLNTIMDYTRIMVLDKGEVAEFDAPQALLQNPDSIFYGMAKDAGLA